MSRRHYINGAIPSSLTGGINSSVTTFAVADLSSYPASFPYTASIDGDTPASTEVILVNAVSGNTITDCVRGYDGTAAQAHSANALFEHVAVKADYDEANSHVNATSAVHGVTGALVGTSDTQTLTNKTLTSPTLNTPTINTPVFTGLQAPVVHVYTSGATWTKPARLVAAFVQVQAGGGGSGATQGAGSGRAASGGGGGGEYRQGWFAAGSLSATETVTVGAGGTAGTIASGSGGDGGNSSFGAHITANGGKGSVTGPNITTAGGSSSGNGGTGGTGGDFGVSGSDGRDGFVDTVPLPGDGGGSFLAGSASGPLFAGNSGNSNIYGGGASGSAASTANTTGAAGGAGIVIVTEYYA